MSDICSGETAVDPSSARASVRDVYGNILGLIAWHDILHKRNFILNSLHGVHVFFS